MRNLAIDHLHAGARGRAGSWYSAMSAALALALAPVTASAGGPSPDAVQPAAEPDPTQPTSKPPPEPGFAPIDIPAPDIPPPPPVSDPEPEPAPEPIVAPVEGPSELQVPSHEQRTKIHIQHQAGIGVMASGGVLVSTGLGMTVAFTILGDAAQSVDQPVTEDIERNDSLARVGGILIVSGVALAAVGGMVLANATRKAKQGSAVARVRVVPALGGLVLSGEF